MNKKMVGLLMALQIVFTVLPSNMIYASDAIPKQQTSTVTTGEVNNATWLKGTTATASWEQADGANYYEVEVFAYYDDKLIGSVTTGTDSNTIDLQQEIHSICDSKNIVSDYVVIDYTVTPVYRSDNGVENKGISSRAVNTLSYFMGEKIQLETPVGIEISEDYIGTWEKVKNADYYKVYLDYSDGSDTYWDAVESFDTNFDFKQYLNEKCKEQMHGDIVYVNFKVCACANDSSIYKSGAYSDKLVSFEYQINRNKDIIATPEDICLDSDYIAKWEKAEGADYYRLYIEFGDDIETYWTTVDCESNQYDFTELFNNWFEKYGVYKMRVRVCGCADDDNQDYITGNYSEYSPLIQLKLNSKELLTTPDIISFDKDLNASWEQVEGAESYKLYLSIRDSDTAYAHWVYTRDNKCDLANELYQFFMEHAFVDSTVTVQFRVRPCTGDVSDKKSSLLSYESDLISYKYNDFIGVDGISISPQKPIIHQGGEYNLGKTIDPVNAYYSFINWSSDNGQVVKIDNMGKITGISEGTANVSAKIGSAMDTVPVTVYTMKSNITNAADKKQVENAAGKAIDEINNNDNPDLSNTNITTEQLNEVRTEINNCIINDDDFIANKDTSEISLDGFDKKQNDIKEKIEDSETGASVLGAYEMSVAVYHKDENGGEHHITDINQTEKAIGFDFSIPRETYNNLKDYNGKYELVYINDGNIEKIDVKDNGNGSFTCNTNKFEEYMLAYVSDDDHINDIQLKGHSISLSGQIGINYYFDIPDYYFSTDGAYIHFMLPENKEINVSLKDAVKSDKIENMYVLTCEVPAAEMTSIITAQIIVPNLNGVKTSRIYTYSVADYANYILNHKSEYNEQLISLVKAMLNYGAYAQRYFGINTDNLANKKIYTDSNNPVLTKTLYDNVGNHVEDENLCFYGASLVCEGQTGLKLYFDIKKDVDVSQIMNRYEVAAFSNNRCRESFCTVNNGKLIVTVNDIAASELDDVFKITLKDKRSNNTQTVSIEYSPLDYIIAAQDSSDLRLVYLTRAMYMYNQAAKEYLN